MISLFYTFRDTILVMDNFVRAIIQPIINVDIIQGGLVRVAHYSLIGAEAWCNRKPN